MIRWCGFASGLVLVALVGGGCVASRSGRPEPAQTELAADRVELPTTVINDYLFVEVRLNGRGPYHLLIDTGASGLCLAKRVADSAGLRSRFASSTRVEGSSDTVPARIANVELIESGGLTLRGMRAAIVAGEALAHLDRYFGRAIDGVLGMTAFTDTVLELDLAGGAVAVARRGVTEYPQERAISYHGITPYVTAEVAGRKVSCLIDTGANLHVVLPDLSNLPLVFPAFRADGEGEIGLGAATQRQGEISQLAGALQIGPLTLTNPPLVRGREAVLGKRALAPWKLVFDHRAQTMYALGEYAHWTWDRRPPPDVTGRAGFYCRIEGTGVRLLEVDAGLAFDRAGLRAGDLMLSVNGEPAVDWLTRGPPAPAAPEAKIHLLVRVRRDQSEFETAVVLGANAYN